MGDIAKNFNRREFMCKCGCGRMPMNERFIEKLQTLRDYICKPINIVSGYRCEKHDKAVGGTGRGTHTLGIAVDMYIDGVPPIEIAKIAEKLGFGGIGIISNTNIHIDMRDESGHGFTYDNKKWFGDERNGKTYSTFRQVSV